RDLAYHPDGKTIGVSTTDGILLFDSTSGEAKGTIKGGLSNYCSLSWSPDGHRLAVGTTRGQIDIFDAQSHNRLITIKPAAAGAADQWGRVRMAKVLDHWITSLDWSADSRRLVSGGKIVTIWGSNQLPKSNLEPRVPGRPEAEQSPIDLEWILANAILHRQGEIVVDGQRIANIAQLPTPPFAIE